MMCFEAKGGTRFYYDKEDLQGVVIIRDSLDSEEGDTIAIELLDLVEFVHSLNI